MKIPSNVIIQDEKLTKYLLVFKPRNDKSKYLAEAGFYLGNWQKLKTEIQKVMGPSRSLLGSKMLPLSA